jgi:hypothetical protein
MIENEQFGEKPRKVRCGKCAHVWQQEPPTPEDIGLSRAVRKEQNENLKKVAADRKAGVKPNLPTVIKTGGIKRLLKVACWLLFVGNVFVFILLNKPLIGQTAFYDLIGDYDSSGVKIETVIFNEPYNTDGKVTYYFDWELKNERSYPVQIPHAKMAMLDGDKNLLPETESEIIGSDETLAKEGKFMFSSNKLVDESKKGRYVVIDIGNPYEIGTRDYN